MTQSVTYHKDGRIARVTLNRPHRFNAIDHNMPSQLEHCIKQANDDPEIRVILLTGAGKSFCSGYDLALFAETPRPCPGSQNMPWDPIVDFQLMYRYTQQFMSIWKSLKPVVCKVQCFAVAGGSDIALCSDFIFMTKDAKMGYPPARLWGCPTTAMWVYRLGMQRAKEMLLTGKLIDGNKAKEWGLATEVFEKPEELDEQVERFVQDMAKIPTNQLAIQKLVINQAYENMGLGTTQILATLMDGVTRHTPEGIAFKQRAETVGFKLAVKERDSDPDKLLSRM